MSQSPDLVAHTANRLGEVAAGSARNMALRKFQSVAKSYLPRVLWPLIPGVGGSVADNAKAGVSRWFWGLVSSAVISLLFFAVFGVAIVGILGVIAFAVLSG